MTPKQATRGQAQIYKENRETIQYYSLASVLGASLYVLLHLLLIKTNGWMAWTGFAVSILLEALALTLMIMSTRCLKNEKGQIIDAGSDLNDTRSYGEYYKDVIIICVIVQLLSLISAYFLLLLLIFPALASYMFWTKIAGPWFFAQPPEEDVAETKGQKRRQQRVNVRR